MDPYKAVYEFHTRFGLPRSRVPHIPGNLAEVFLRLRLIHEEYEELLEGLIAGDVVKVADALTDMEYVINGMAVVFGIDLNACLTEVHRANMDKIDPTTGKPVYREDGKVLKPEGWKHPDIKAVLRKQLEGLTLDDADNSVLS